MVRLLQGVQGEGELEKNDAEGMGFYTPFTFWGLTRLNSTRLSATRMCKVKLPAIFPIMKRAMIELLKSARL